MEPLDWVRWCHQDDPDVVRSIALQRVQELQSLTPDSDPLVLVRQLSNGVVAVAYGLIQPGALGLVSGMRSFPMFESHESVAVASQPSEETERELQMAVLLELFKKFFERGMELVQAVNIEHSALHTDDATNRMLLALRNLNVWSVRLTQLTNSTGISLPDDRRAASTVELVDYHAVPWNDWCRLVEGTYRGSQDVPELNGVRSIQETLTGYAAGAALTDVKWWVIRYEGNLAGCLLLTEFDRDSIELTYVGLLPEFRRRGLSWTIMQFIQRWMQANEKREIVLAVDQRNMAATRLYERCGFRAQRTMRAWIESRYAFEQRSVAVPMGSVS